MARVTHSLCKEKRRRAWERPFDGRETGGFGAGVCCRTKAQEREGNPGAVEGREDELTRLAVLRQTVDSQYGIDEDRQKPAPDVNERTKQLERRARRSKQQASGQHWCVDCRESTSDASRREGWLMASRREGCLMAGRSS